MADDRDSDESDLTIAAAALASSANAVTEVGAELREVRAAVSQTGERVASLERSVGALDARASRRLDDLRAQQETLTAEVRAANERRERTPVAVAPVPSRWKARAFAALAGAFATLLIGALAIWLWRACSGPRPVGLADWDSYDDADGIARRGDGGSNPPKAPPPPQEPRPPKPDPDRDPIVPDKTPPEFYRWINCNGSPKEDSRLCPSLQRKRRINP